MAHPPFRFPGLRPWIFPVLTLVFITTMGVTRLSGSSVGIYGLSSGESEAEAGVAAGSARPIRSDEWFVRTPWVLRQAELDLPVMASGGVGTHDVAVLGDLPVRGWEGVLRPHALVYRIFDIEHAFALEWWLFPGIQMLGIYTLLLAVTRRPAVSAVASSLVTFSPATQWWWIPGAFLTIGYAALAAGLMLLAIRLRSWWGGMVAAASAVPTAAFLTTLYVPWQIGTLLVVGPVALGAIVAEVVDAEDRRGMLRHIGAALVVGVGFGGAGFAAFALKHRRAFETIAATLYPGDQPARRGGSVDLRSFWGSALDYFAADGSAAVVNGTNQSENASALVLMVPAALVVFALFSAGQLRRHRSIFPLIGGLVGGCIMLGWMLLPIPASLGRFLLLTRVTPSRMFLPLGLAGVLVVALLISYVSASRASPPRGAALIASGSFAAAQAWAAGHYVVNEAPIRLPLAAAFIAIVSVGVFLSFGSRPVLGLAALAAFSLWQASLINPLQKGLDPLIDNPLRSVIDRLRTERPGDEGWVAFSSDVVIRGTLTAAGINHLSGISPYPDHRSWRLLDPDRQYEHVWNRYAHVSFVTGPAGAEPKIVLLGADSLQVTIDPCAPELEDLQVRFLVFQQAEEPACGRLLARAAHGGGRVSIYERFPGAAT